MGQEIIVHLPEPQPVSGKPNGHKPLSGGVNGARPKRVPLPRNRATLQQPLPAEAASPEQRRQGVWDKGKSLAVQPRILDSLVRELEAQGVVGEQRAAKLIYLVVTSRLLARPISAAVRGPSSAGKSFLADRVVSFFPASATYKLTGMSEKALAYGQEPLKHRTLVVAEAAGLAGGSGAYFMRSLISEGSLRYKTVDSGTQGLKPMLIEREGPTNLLVTTTALHLDNELETRLLSIPVDDGPEQTRAIIRAQAARYSTAMPSTDPDLSPWVALQEWLELSEHRVVIPFADGLVKAIPPVALRLRRDVPAILGLITTHAILHQATRERGAQGEVIATVDDYAVVRELVADLVAHGVGASVPETVRQTVDAVRAANTPFGLPLPRIGDALKLDKSTVSRRVNKAIEMGYLRNEEPALGHPARIVIAKPLPEEVEMLPPPEAL